MAIPDKIAAANKINEFLRKAYRSGSDSVRIENASGQRYLGIGFSTKQEDGTRRKAIALRP